MDSVSVPDAIVTSITTAAEDILRVAAGCDELEKTVLGPVRVSLQKYQEWQQVWCGVTHDPDVFAAEAFWGLQGWSSIRGMLDKILKYSEHIRKSLNNIKEPQATKPTSRWKAAVKAPPSKQQSSENLGELRNLAAALSTFIDELWIFSESLYDSLHGVLAHETKLPEFEKLLTLALQSRAGSLDLHTLCSNLPEDCCLEIDLLDTGPLSMHRSNRPEHSSGRLFYHLFAQAREYPQDIKQLTVEIVPELDDSESATNDDVEPDEPDVQLFKSQSGTGTKKIMVSRYGSSPSSCLFLPRTVGTMRIETKPERLASLLARPEKGRILSNVKSFSVGAKIKLAYKVIECGFFLIGTPWFSSLSSKNILSLRSLGQKSQSFILEVQTVDPDDLLSEDPGAFLETTQLFRIGILLMEIALGEPNGDSEIERYGHDAELISKLPLVEQAMGTQYCKATAFCLLHRQPKDRFRGPEKYQGEKFAEWQSYLAGFLREYHSQVFLRLQELRDLDAKPGYGSGESWRDRSAE